MLSSVGRFLGELDADKAWRIEVREYKATRSSAQNRYLWAIYDHIIKVGGETMGGWTKEDLHDFFLGEHFGWEKVQLFGRFRLKPIKRSSNLSKMDFADFIAYIQHYMAERGVVIPDAESYGIKL